eukprot:1165387-Amphidinium_carterae.1
MSLFLCCKVAIAYKASPNARSSETHGMNVLWTPFLPQPARSFEQSFASSVKCYQLLMCMR